MTRFVPVDKPLSDEDREYLHARGEHDRVTYIDEMHSKSDDPTLSVFDSGDDVEPDRNYDEWTVPEIDDEIRVRNEATGRPNDRRLSTGGKKEEKVARLRQDDSWLDSQA
jgi:hypothetical protein